MPKEGSGRNELQNVALDLIALLDKAESRFTELLMQVDKCISADMSNDPDLSQAHYFLTESETVDPEKAQRMRHAASSFLEVAMDKDFTDSTKEDLKAMLMPYLTSLSQNKASALKLMEKINKRQDGRKSALEKTES